MNKAHEFLLVNKIIKIYKHVQDRKTPQSTDRVEKKELLTQTMEKHVRIDCRLTKVTPFMNTCSLLSGQSYFVIQIVTVITFDAYEV